jgi:adenylyltransferase/sulfurtransferase
MYLAAAGVGEITVIDDDVVEMSNLQRQIIHKTDAIGTSKVSSASDTVGKINPDVKIIQIGQRLDSDNIDTIVKNCDIIADGCDNFATRFLVSEAATKYKKPLVSAALSQFDGQIATFKGYETDKPCYRCFVPSAPDMVQNCAEAGILGAVAGVLGTLQATEVLKEILGIGESLAGKIMIYDALYSQMRTIKLPKDPACKFCL